MQQSLIHPSLLFAISQRFAFTSSSSPEPEKEANQSDVSSAEADNKRGDATSSEKPDEADVSLESKGSNSQSNKRKSTKRTEFSDSEDEKDLTFDDLVKLVAEKEELLKLKHKEIEKMQDKVLRSYAEMENVIDRTKREAESSKKFAIQVKLVFFFFCLHILLFCFIVPVFSVNMEKYVCFGAIMCRVLLRAY